MIYSENEKLENGIGLRLMVNSLVYNSYDFTPSRWIRKPYDINHRVSRSIFHRQESANRLLHNVRNLINARWNELCTFKKPVNVYRFRRC